MKWLHKEDVFPDWNKQIVSNSESNRENKGGGGVSEQKTCRG